MSNPPRPSDRESEPESQASEESVIPQQWMWAGILSLLGALLVTLGSVVPYSRLGGQSRVFAPEQIPFSVWWPSAAEPALAILGSVAMGVWLLVRRRPNGLVAGMSIALGALTAARYLAYALDFHFFAGGGVVGVGGVIGMAGGFVIAVAGALLSGDVVGMERG